MPNLSNWKYIVGFCTVVCLVCSIFVAGAAVGLKEKQEANEVLDRQKKVLVVAGLLAEDAKVAPAEVEKLYQTHVRPRVVDLTAGAYDEKIDGSKFKQAEAEKDPQTSRAATADETRITGLKRISNKVLIYEVVFGNAVEMRILPVQGKGLWSTLFGYLALDRDGNTIRGITFYKHGETPGLGGEVDNPAWKAAWPGRKAYDEKGAPAIKVVKGRASATAVHDIDGLSGATITGNGVTKFVQFWLGPQGYGPFLAQMQKGVKS